MNDTQHAWFIGYGPFGASVEKSVVVVVMVEYGIGGAAVAAPIARNIFAKIIEQGYFKEDNDVKKR
jgi:penicillin-binding protein 2